MPMTAEIFYQIASREVTTLTFPTEKDAIRYRLRLYKAPSSKSRDKSLHWPSITILLRGNKLIAGPKDFDIFNIEMTMDEKTKASVLEFETLEEDKEMSKWLEIQRQRDAKTTPRQEGDEALAKLGFGKKHDDDTK